MEGCIHDTVVFSHRLKNQSQNLAKEAGMDWLSGPQGRVVTYLFHHQDQPVTMMEVAEKMKISKPVASQLFKRMEKNQLIDIKPDPRDKRRKCVTLTEQGLVKQAQVSHFLTTIHDQLLEGLSEQDLQVFHRVIRQLTQNLEHIEYKGVDHV